jgi:putative PEP-CTERM system integral membrane protein
MNENQKTSIPGETRRRLQQWLFWSWNVIFLAVMVVGFLPSMVPDIVRSVQQGTTPPIYLIFSLVLVLIPIAATLLGIFVLRKSPQRLFALGYVVEWPLLLILLFYFALIREGNPAITLLLVWLAIGLATFLWHLLDQRIDEHKPLWIYLRLAGLSLLFAGTIYAAIWLAFYVPPIAVYGFDVLKQAFTNMMDMFKGLITDIEYLRSLPLNILALLLAIFSASLIILMPVVAPILAGRAWLHSLRAGMKPGGRWAALGLSALPVVAVVILLVLSMRQPQIEAFALLENPPATAQQAQTLIQRQEVIRAGLVNAYLAPYRYLSAAGEVRHVSDLYAYTLNMPKETAWKFEMAYEVVIQPLLYTPVHPAMFNAPESQALQKESAEAAQLYEQFFDNSIAKGEQQAIVSAVRDNPNGSQAELAWQAVDDREVHLNQQEVNIAEHGDWADVEIHEVYQNRTSQRQEVVYYFSLPETAVITGLWLGSTADRSQASAFQVAPRGAAQASYRNEVRMNIDPALVEQIGPRQYRLRAFPILPSYWSETTRSFSSGAELHLWLRYQVMAQDGAWPLPQLADRRNVFWDGSSTRTINAKSMAGSASAWLPGSVPASQPVKAAAHRVDFPDGQTVIARPLAAIGQQAIAADLHLAIVLDRSYSMNGYSTRVKQALDELKRLNPTASVADLYLTASKFRGSGPTRMVLASYSPDEEVYFGGQNAADLLLQYEQLSGGQKYDAVLVITDGSGFELGQSDAKLAVPDAPVWIVHLGGGFPLGYDDPTLQAIQASGGGVAGSVEEALQRYSAGRQNAGQVDRLEGYEWLTVPTSQAGALTDAIPVRWQASAQPDGFTALAARRLVLSKIVQNKAALDQLTVLDQLNKLAVDSSIVTPYSSMIVLINDRQQQTLNQFEAQADRYQREVEGIGTTVPLNGVALPITGVPEPEEWLLIALAVVGLGYAYRRRLNVVDHA